MILPLAFVDHNSHTVISIWTCHLFTNSYRRALRDGTKVKMKNYMWKNVNFKSINCTKMSNFSQPSNQTNFVQENSRYGMLQNTLDFGLIQWLAATTGCIDRTVPKMGPASEKFYQNFRINFCRTSPKT